MHVAPPGCACLAAVRSLRRTALRAASCAAPTRRRSHRAFTLVEALAVVALMGIVLPGVMYGIATSTSAAGVVKQRAAAAEVAANKLSEIILAQEWQSGALTGETVQDQTSYHWAAAVDNWQGQTNIEQLTIEVDWKGQGRPRSVKLSTLVYQSPSSTQAGVSP